jgi:hypothetical protein
MTSKVLKINGFVIENNLGLGDTNLVFPTILRLTRNGVLSYIKLMPFDNDDTFPAISALSIIVKTFLSKNKWSETTIFQSRPLIDKSVILSRLNGIFNTYSIIKDNTLLSKYIFTLKDRTVAITDDLKRGKTRIKGFGINPHFNDDAYVGAVIDLCNRIFIKYLEVLRMLQYEWELENAVLIEYYDV